MVFGYNVKEEATEIKNTVKNSRGSIITLVIAGLIGGIVTQLVVPKRITDESIIDRFKSWFSGDHEDE